MNKLSQRLVCSQWALNKGSRDKVADDNLMFSYFLLCSLVYQCHTVREPITRITNRLHLIVILNNLFTNIFQMWIIFIDKKKKKII